MNRLVYYKENGETKVEWQKITHMSKNGAEAKFKVNDKPAYLQIFFNRQLEEDELFDIYAVLIEHHIIKMSREEMERNIREDLTKQFDGVLWELKCHFQDALNCAVRLSDDILFGEGAFTFQISDEPTERMKKWLDKKNAAKEEVDSI